jgi:erythrin-vacuolar iron transport family protein
MKTFSDLTEQELLALAISSEEDDARGYAAFANVLMPSYAASAKVFLDMSAEEYEHRDRLTKLYKKKFGDFIPLIRRADVNGFVKHKPAFMIAGFGIDAMRKHAEVMELENARFYTQAAAQATDLAVKDLLLKLAAAEKGHETLARRLGATHVTDDVKVDEKEAERRLFLLQVIQPGLVGLMDGSVSTLAPLFAAAFATGDTWETPLPPSAPAFPWDWPKASLMTANSPDAATRLFAGCPQAS